MANQVPKGFVERNTALCYVRLSYTRQGDDTNSPERQRANIQTLCERNGWIPEWYEDTKGHKSGRYEKNRPQWLALKARLGDPDVVALVANDLSRLHRKGWRVGDLIDYLNKYEVNLALAAPGREVDTTTMKGRMFVQFAAIVDEYYAEDISQRAKDNVAFRKSQGKSVGMPPFGTVRDKDGFLTATAEDVWLLPSGMVFPGEPTVSPEETALWRGYYDATLHVLQLYAEGHKGLEKIAYQMNREGWAFRDRKGNPRPFEHDDVRRIVSNWPEYGGLIAGKRGKDRPAYAQYNPDDILFRAERAVVPIDLLRRVALIRQQRTIRPPDQSVKQKAHPYAFSTLLFCSYCDQRANHQNNARLRSLLSGNTPHDGSIRRYRHKPGVTCGCTNRSVPCEIVEQDFQRLIDLLTIEPDALDLMTELAIQADKDNGAADDTNLEQQKQEAIALCRKRIDAAVVLFGDGMIGREEYKRRVEANEREIAHWEARTTETQKLAMELAMCMSAVDKLARLWDGSDAEDKQGLVRSLFTQISYDLDTQRIVDFKLKAWADRFLVLRASLYEDTTNTKKGETKPPEGGQGSDQTQENRPDEMRNEVSQRPRGEANPGFGFERCSATESSPNHTSTR